MLIHIDATGNTPIMFHNERLSYPDDPYARQIAELTAKKTNQTEKDKQDIANLEWRGGIYTDEKGIVVVPTKNIIKALRQGGTVTKFGTKMATALSPTAIMVPLLIGPDRKPKHFEELMGRSEYYDRRPVKVQKARIIRTRPMFPVWALSFDLELFEDVINYDRFVSILELTGRAFGLCDARIIGYGRFDTKVKIVKAAKAAA